MTLDELANAVKSNFQTLQESEIIGRIMIISGRSFDRSVKGYQMLIEKNLIPENFIDPETKGIFFELLKAKPGVKTIIDKFDCIPGKMKLLPKIEVTFLPPPKLSEAELLQRLNFSNLDF
jgi:hypothetical protein